jgi:WS/DGAT/MGAT family acyltransferase
MYQVDSEDANFLFMEQTDSPTHISLLYFYDQSALKDEPIRFTHIREHIGNRLNSAPVFRQKIKRTPANIDYPYWVDDEQFDLDFHVRHLALPKPGDWRQFCIQIARLHSRSLDMSRPLWELYVIEGLEAVEGLPPNSFAIYFKVHHCAMDEFTAKELLESLHAQTPNRRQHESSAQHIALLPSLPPQPLEMLIRGMSNNSLRSIRLLVQSVSNLRSASRIVARLALRAVRNVVEGDTPEREAGSRFAQPLGQSRVFEGGFYPRQSLESLMELVPGTTLTHTLLTVCGEATRRYLHEHGEIGNCSLNALLEVNVRNAGAHAMAGNRIAINQVGLHTAVIFPEGRLQAIFADQRELHTIENEELTRFRLRSLYENLPAPLLAWMGKTSNNKNSLTHRIMEGGNLGLSELEGSRKQLYLLGARLHGFTGISPLYSGCGLMFTTSTYDDKIGITFTSDRNMMPDPERMRRCLDETMEELDSYLASKARDPKKVAKGKKRSRPNQSRSESSRSSGKSSRTADSQTAQEA